MSCDSLFSAHPKVVCFGGGEVVGWWANSSPRVGSDLHVFELLFDCAGFALISRCWPYFGSFLYKGYLLAFVFEFQQAALVYFVPAALNRPEIFLLTSLKTL